MTDLSRAAIQAVDTQGMLGDVLDQPHQLTDALWRVESAGISTRDLPGGLLVCGMGGSAIGADLAAAAIGERATHPIRSLRGYSVEPWLGADTLVLCSSYSGDTEETLACYEAAGEAGAARIALTTGGRLAEAARADGVPVIGVPSGFLPRAAVAYMTVGAIECARLAGAAPAVRDEIEAAAALLPELAAEWGPDSGADSQAKALAGRLAGTVPVFYGAGITAAAAHRWKAQLNENAKSHAFFAELPEADHNEICGWGEGPFAAVFMDDPQLHPRVRRRIDLTAEVIERHGAPVEVIESRGVTPFERLMSLVFLGDLLSVYLAVLAGTDPSPMEPIEELKRRLAEP